MLPLFQTGGGSSLAGLIGCPVPLTGPKFVSGFGVVASPAAGASTTFYTVPNGKRALILWGGVYAETATSSAFTPKIQLGGSGTLYPLSAGVTTSSSVGLSSLSIAPLMAEAGDVIAITNSVLNASYHAYIGILEFDATSPLKSLRIVSDGSTTTPNSGKIVNGDCLIYTVTAGKTALVLSSWTGMGVLTAGLQFSNTSGGTRTYKWNVVPNGGSVGVTNRVSATTLANNALAFIANQQPWGFTLNAGDFISFNSDANTTGQLAIVMYAEF